MPTGLRLGWELLRLSRVLHYVAALAVATLLVMTLGHVRVQLGVGPGVLMTFLSGLVAAVGVAALSAPQASAVLWLDAGWRRTVLRVLPLVGLGVSAGVALAVSASSGLPLVLGWSVTGAVVLVLASLTRSPVAGVSMGALLLVFLVLLVPGTDCTERGSQLAPTCWYAP